MLAPQKESYVKSRQCTKKQRYHFASKGPYCQSYGFSSSHVWMWKLNHKEGCASVLSHFSCVQLSVVHQTPLYIAKVWCFQVVVLDKTLESSLDSKEIKPVNPKGNQPWISTGNTDEEAENLILWPPDAEPTHWKIPSCSKRLKAKEKRVAEDDMVR